MRKEPDSPHSRRRQTKCVEGRSDPSWKERADAICEELTKLASEIWDARRDERPDDLLPPVMNLSLQVPLAGDQGVEPLSGDRLYRDLLAEMENCFRPEVFREGRAYCFLCESTECEHSLPSGPKAVFAGYGTNGKPEWQEFSNVLIRTGDDRVDLLYAEKPFLIAVAQAGRDLAENQLDTFGKKSRTHRVLAQVISGYFPGPPSNGSRERWAMTVQAVEYRDGKGEPRLDLNVISGALGDGGMTGILTHENNEPLYETIARARGRIASIGRSSINPRSGDWYSRKFESRVLAVLGDLAHFLERNSHLRHRRTRHAREERTRRDRPIAAALKDLERASPEDFHFDEANHTIVIVGPHLRTHIFSPEGKLVTSINYDGDQVRKKRQTHAWRPATSEEISAFRKAARSFRSKSRERRASPDVAPGNQGAHQGSGGRKTDTTDR